MDTPLKYHQHYHRVIPYATSNTSANQNARSHVGFAMPLTDLNLKRILRSNPITRFNHRKLFCLDSNNVIVKDNLAMADEAKEKNQLLNVDDNKEKGEEKKVEKSTQSIPPPPEKPLPDDCCGSGCVRCVWDVYYDELEDYNKLYGDKNSSN